MFHSRAASKSVGETSNLVGWCERESSSCSIYFDNFKLLAKYRYSIIRRLRSNNEQHRGGSRKGRGRPTSSTDRAWFGLLLSNDRQTEREKDSERRREERERKTDNKDDIAPLAAASALGKDGTAVSEGGKAGRQRKKGKEREKIRNEEGRKRREGDTDSRIEKKREGKRERRV